ncbi:MAG: DUF2203 domain-containing protein [Planctomycetes bacterium]|nr:DUF2203 domain-containing protein [Planctomycetota bacterium]
MAARKKSEKNPKRYFTIEEANKALPLVRAIVSDIVAKYAAVSERKSRLDQIRESRSTHGRGRSDLYGEELAQVEEELDREIAQLQEYIDELETIGVELKDISRGLVDFLGKIDGRDVYLCWLLGEEEVSHWHELEAGFAGRQSLLANSPAGSGSEHPDAGDTAESGED